MAVKIRRFRISKQLLRISRWILRKTRIRLPCRLTQPNPIHAPKKPMSELISWGRRLTNGAKSLCSAKPGSGYAPLGPDPVEDKPDRVPKGHLAVYVGGKDGDGDGDREFHRVFVPVIYFNHPLFGELLREAEEEYGFCQPGGLTIPCPFSDFERIRTRIRSGSGYRRVSWRRRR